MTESEFQECIITMGYRYNEKSKTAFNTFEGFHNLINFGGAESRYLMRLECGLAEGVQPDEVEELLRQFHSEFKESVSHTALKRRYIVIELKKTIDSGIDRESLKTLVHFITELCKSGKIIPLCRVCGRSRKTGVYIVGTEAMPICDACVVRKRRLYEKRRDLFEKKKQHMAGGLAGAVFGAMLGAMIYILMYQLTPQFIYNNIPGARGTWSIFIVILSFCGFVVTGRRATKKSGVICSIISVLIFAVSEYAAMVLETAIYIEREGGGIAVSESIGITNSGLMDASAAATLLPEVSIGIIVILAAGAVYFLKRALTRPMKISGNLL